MDIQKLLLVSAFCFSLLYILPYNTSAEEQAEHEETFIPYRNWNDYSEEEIQKLADRWPPDKVKKILEALQNSKSLDGLVNKIKTQYEFESYDLRSIRFPDGTNLDSVNVPGANFQGARLSGANFTNATLEQANFEEAFLAGANFTNANLHSVNLQHSYLWVTNFKEAFLRGTNFEEADLGRADFQGSDLVGANFAKSKLNETNLKDADLFDAYFELTYLWRTNLGEAKNIRYILWGEKYETNDELISYLKEKFPEQIQELDTLKKETKNNPLIGQRQFIGYLKLVLGVRLAYVIPSIPSDPNNNRIDEKEVILNENKQSILNLASVIPTNERYIIGEEKNWDLENAEITYRDLNSFYKEEKMDHIANEFHYRANVVKTKISSFPIKIFRTVFLDWTYGYGSRPLRLFLFMPAIILLFAIIYLFQTILPGESSLYENNGANTNQAIILPGNELKTFFNCLYFSSLSFSTFGYGALQPYSWVKYFRFKPVEIKPDK